MLQSRTSGPTFQCLLIKKGIEANKKLSNKTKEKRVTQRKTVKKHNKTKEINYRETSEAPIPRLEIDQKLTSSHLRDC